MRRAGVLCLVLAAGAVAAGCSESADDPAEPTGGAATELDDRAAQRAAERQAEARRRAEVRERRRRARAKRVRERRAAARQAAAAAQAPEPAPEPEPECDPNYSGACVPIASDVDCAGGSGDGPEYVAGPVYVTGTDIYGLDADGDGVACE